MDVPLFHVDAFTSEPFRGNPAAVVILPSPLVPDSVLAAVAAELNLSETAFVYPPEASDPFEFARTATRCRLRWFTPTKEVALCGHATLATAHTLMFETGNSSDSITFDTLSGPLVVTRQSGGNGAGGSANRRSAQLRMRFPHNPPVVREWRTPAEGMGSLASEEGAWRTVVQLVMSQMLQLPADGAAAFHSAADAVVHSLLYNATTGKLVVRLKDDQLPLLLRLPVPATAPLLAIDQSALPPTQRISGVSVTVRAVAGQTEAPLQAVAAGVDFYSRYFSPWNGIPEDPVNGSSHTILGPYWAHQLDRMRDAGGGEGSRDEVARPMRQGLVVGYQASSRGGVVTVRVTEPVPAAAPAQEPGTALPAATAYVHLEGYAVTVAAGRLRL